MAGYAASPGLVGLVTFLYDATAEQHFSKACVTLLSTLGDTQDQPVKEKAGKRIVSPAGQEDIVIGYAKDRTGANECPNGLNEGRRG